MRRHSCKFQIRGYRGGTIYYDCLLTDLATPQECPFPARQCRFKQQTEEFRNGAILVRNKARAE